ncbi:PASTA domain-containing protein, partial [Candidatus Sumerlaeota bacterium]|nr:PASTA domain-containing protein [Candidatus Sumerlaeota bacterium]
MIVATGVFFGLLGLASYYIIGYYMGRHGQEIPAPNVVGKPLSAALSDIKKWNLSILLDREEESDAVAPGDIISQDPAVGVVIKMRTPIRVVVSSGPKN